MENIMPLIRKQFIPFSGQREEEIMDLYRQYAEIGK